MGSWKIFVQKFKVDFNLYFMNYIIGVLLKNYFLFNFALWE